MSEDRARQHLPAPEPPRLGEPPAPRNPSLQVDAKGIAWITFNDPGRKVNVLDEGVMHAFSDLLEELARLAGAGIARVAVFRSGKPDSFIAGADMDAIAGIEEPRDAEKAARLGQAIFFELENLPLPTVAAIHGVCVGGATELALACRFRVASDSPKTKIGLPEVQLGILPAWGGTTRLPRLVGLQNALDMLLTGKTLSASRARKIGLVSEVFPAELFRAKVAEFALDTLELPKGSSRRKRPVLRRLVEDTPPGRRAVLAVAKRKVLARTGGNYPAPLRILEVLKDGLGTSLGRSLDLEARAAGELIVSPVSKNLIRVFNLREHARKRPDVAPGAEPILVGRIGVLGAGVMGGGIAQLAAYNGIHARMKDIRHEAVASGLQHARGLFDAAVEKRRLRAREAEQRMELISGGIEYHGFANVDLVIEAVVERMDVKRAVLREVEGHVRPGCILATNTSSLSVDGMAEGLERPERLCGMHFFNPVHRMPLVEVVRGARTDDEAILTVHALALRLGKVPVIVKDGPGFVVNRVLGPYLNEAAWLLQAGASVAEVDRVARDFGMPMGPLRLIDEVGIDIAVHAGRSLHEAFGERLAPAPIFAALAHTERLGRKNGRGFYVYRDDDGGDGGGDGEVDDSVYAELGLGVPTDGSGPGHREIRSRLMLAMVNEAARTLGDRIVPRAGDVDLAMIMGTGFPPFRGGPLRFADSLQLRTVLERVEALQARHGVRFEPAPLLEELARQNRTFHDAFRR
jgi:3-hydroxyacyl-CoA dehydrogenase/enoyl-CoA hydratase/3-hydroxybutyryl-CoA epimerase